MTVRALTSLSAIALMAATASPVAAQAANEVELHIEASAQVPPDRAVVPVTLIGRGKTEKAARDDVAARERDLAIQLAQAGIGQDKIKPDPSSDKPAVAFEAPVLDAACAAAQAETAADAAADAAATGATVAEGKAIASAECGPSEPVATARKTLLVDVGDASKVDLLKSAEIEGFDEGYGRLRPVYSQSNPVAARAKARDLALAKARADADAYAGAMGYRIVRMARVSNARPGISMHDLIGFFATIEDRSSRMQPSWFASAVTESVSIDFVMVPK